MISINFSCREDCIVLGNALESSPSVAEAFEQYENIRKTRSAKLVQQSYEMGNKIRMVPENDVPARNAKVRELWADAEKVRERFDFVYQADF